MTTLDKALSILAAFNPERPEIRMRELSAITGLSEPTVHRLTATLVRWGALQREPRGPFSVGTWLLPIAASAALPRSLRELAVPLVSDLYEATGENVLLAIRDGDDALVVLRMVGRRAVARAAGDGERLPLHASGVGLVLLAYGNDALRQRVLSHGVQGYTEHTTTDPAKLRLTLDTIRDRGYAVGIRLMRDDSMSIAAPIFDPDGGIAAAVSVVVRARDADAQRYVPLVVTVANGISRSLGSARRIRLQ